MNPRIQGRVAPEKYDLYKKTKKEFDLMEIKIY